MDDAGSNGVSVVTRGPCANRGAAEIFNAVEIEVGIYNRHGVRPSWRTGLMPGRTSRIAEKFLEWHFEYYRHKLALCVRP